MSFSSGFNDIVKFNSGLISEATPLTFPENATLDEENFDILDDGSRARRHGIDMEDVSYTTHDAAASISLLESLAITSFVWKTNSNTVQKIVVIQIGTTYKFFNGDASLLAASTVNGGAAITLAGSPSSSSDYTVVNGQLIVCNGRQGFFVLSYNDNTNAITSIYKTIKVRDIWGVDDGLAVTSRPSSLSRSHRYNLLNQGWPTSTMIASHHKDHYHSGLKDPLSWTKTILGAYPSNADIMSSALVGARSSAEAYWPQDLDQFSFGNTEAPKGKTVLDLFKRGAGRRSLIGSRSLPEDTSSGGVVTAQFFAGRLWVACSASQVSKGDSRSPDIGSYVYFSQVAENSERLNRFYQEGDPTSRDTSDIIDSDGGALKLPGIVNILSLLSTSRSLIVLASNGIWEISGGEGNFSATSLEVRKISDETLTSKHSFVPVDNRVFYWGESGINILEQDEVSGLYSSSSLTDSTIKSFYKNIPAASKQNAVGIYDSLKRKIRWLYNGDLSYTGPKRKRFFTKELALDLVYKAFTVNSFKGTAIDFAFPAGYVEASPISTTIEQDTVTANSVDVTENAVDVTVPVSLTAVGDSSIKYLTFIDDSGAIKYGFSEQINPNFKDWQRIDGVGVDASAYMLSGYSLFESAQKEKQTPYLTVHMDRCRDLDLGEGYLVTTPPPVCGTTIDSTIYALDLFDSSPGALSIDSATTFTVSAVPAGSFTRYGDTYIRRSEIASGVDVSTDFRTTWTNVPTPGSPSWGSASDIIRIPTGFMIHTRRTNPFPLSQDGIFTYIGGVLTPRTPPYAQGSKRGNANQTAFSTLTEVNGRVYALNAWSNETYSPIKYTDDLGETWSNITSSSPGLMNTALSGVPYYNGSTWLMITRLSSDDISAVTQLFTSTDGKDWTLLHSDFAVTIGATAGTILGVSGADYELAYANGRWLFVTVTDTLWRDVYSSTDDGATWTKTFIGESLVNPKKIYAIDNTFYFYDPNVGRIGTSCDGITWVDNLVANSGTLNGELIPLYDQEPDPSVEP